MSGHSSHFRTSLASILNQSVIASIIYILNLLQWHLSMTTAEVDPYKGEREGKLREVGCQAVWSLSSCKAGKTSSMSQATYIKVKVFEM